MSEVSLIPNPEFITEDWLRSVGFKWHDEHQYVSAVAKAKEKGETLEPRKHWTLWFGSFANLDEDGKRRMFTSDEDLGVELSQSCTGGNWWHCWLRTDISHRYSRFLHIRHVRTTAEVVALTIGLTGRPWKPENHLYGIVRTDEEIEHLRKRDERLDIVLAKARPWYESEKDEASGRADVTDLRINREKEGLA